MPKKKKPKFPLTYKQIDRFIKKVAGEEVIVTWQYHDDSNGCVAAIAQRVEGPEGTGYVILLNDYTAEIWKRETFKAILMHEIGHIKTGMPSSKPKYRREFEAHIWAIERARELNMCAIERRLIELFKLWEECDWNSSFRSYRIAAKMAKEKGITK